MSTFLWCEKKKYIEAKKKDETNAISLLFSLCNETNGVGLLVLFLSSIWLFLQNHRTTHSKFHQIKKLLNLNFIFKRSRHLRVFKFIFKIFWKNREKNGEEMGPFYLISVDPNPTRPGGRPRTLEMTPAAMTAIKTPMTHNATPARQILTKNRII